MAYDKLVDSSQLNSDLGDVADAIRAKSGGSSQLAFPSGFISEIGNISTGGGGGTTTNLVTGTFTPSSVTATVEVECDFEPDYILIQGDLTQDVTLWGVKMLWIVRDDEAYMLCDTNQSNLATSYYGVNGITDLNNSITTANHPSASYQNNILTVDSNGNRDYTKFCAGITYRYFLFAS